MISGQRVDQQAPSTSPTGLDKEVDKVKEKQLQVYDEDYNKDVIRG
jgi:hypothetical protein